MKLSTKRETSMNKDVCYVITNPMIASNRSSEVTLSKFLRVISAVYKNIDVIGGNLAVEPDVVAALHTWRIHRARSKAKRLLDIAFLQIKMTCYVLKNFSSGDHVYFWIGDKMLLPFLAAKSKGADVRYFLYGNVIKEGIPTKAVKLSGKIIAWMANHANSVCVESPGVLKEWDGLIQNKQHRCIHLYTEIPAICATTEQEPIIGMLCRLTEGKHVLESIEAFAEFCKVHPQYTLEIIGSGKQEQLCKEAIDSLGLGRCVRLLGWVDHENIVDKIQHWKYLLFPSDTEGMPNSVLEAMGCGVPVLASPVGGVRDLIMHGRNGWFLQDTSKEGILSGLNLALSADKDYEKISSEAFKIVCERFSLASARENAQKNCQDC